LTADILVKDDDHSGTEMLSQPRLVHPDETGLKALVRFGLHSHQVVAGGAQTGPVGDKEPCL
jgi:hypothetical protein